MTPRSPYRVLVVEDDAAFARTLVRRLERQGHHVCVARDGREGMKAIVDQSPDLVAAR